jgi:elongation factor G
MVHSSDQIRNVVLFGHNGAGKTAFLDALAFKTKITARHGKTADGTSLSDTEPEEKERGQTLASHVLRLPLAKGVLHLLDTPGHPDFLADSISAMHVAEVGALCVNAASGLSFHARRLWKAADRASLGRAIVLTHPDGENVDFDSVLADLQEVLGDAVVPLSYPDKSGAAFSVVHDVMAGEGPSAKEYRDTLEERVAEADDAIMEAYLEQGSMTEEDLRKHFPTAVAKGKVIPLFTVCPTREIGLEVFLSAAQELFPSPAAFGARQVAVGDGENFDQLVEPDPSGPFAAMVFKVVVDPYVGRLSYLRCMRGSLKAEEGFVNVRTGKKEKIGGLLSPKGKETEPIPGVVAGDIFAVGKLEDLEIGDAVTVESSKVRFPPIQYPEPTYALAVTPKSRGDEQKIAAGLEKLATEDPTFHIRRDAVTGELIIAGMSPLHLDVHLMRLQRRYGVGTEHHLPSVPYRETILTVAEGHHRHKKQTGGRGQFAEVYLRAKPLPSGSGFEYIDSVVGGSIPRQFIPEVEKGIKKFLAKGVLAGCPVVDVAAEVYDGKYHDVDSDQLSFQLAGERAFHDAFMKAKPILLEPIMEVEIHVPERFTGDVAGNISSQRGRMSGMEMHDGIQTIKAHVPLKEMQDYSTQLRSITAGEGTFTMRPHGFEQVPPNIQQEIVAAHKRRLEQAK